MESLQLVARCKACGSLCPSKLEKLTETPSRTVMIESNEHHHKSARDDLDEKLNVWRAAAPPLANESSKYSIDLIALEKANAVIKGTIVLTEPLNIGEIKIYSAHGEDDDEDEEEEDREHLDNADDDDDETAKNIDDNTSTSNNDDDDDSN